MEQYYQAVVYILSSLLGLCVGSFLNVVIYRVPKGMNLAKPSSHCTCCGYNLRWYDNIPVLSYLMLGGKCRKCKTHISIRYMLVEMANAILWLLSAILFWDKSPIYACAIALACSVFICIFFIDLEHMLIYNRFTLIIFILGIVTLFFDPHTIISDHIVGCLSGTVFFLLIYFGSILILKKEGIGFGDVKLVAAAGLLLGWQKLIFSILVSSIIASITLITLRYMRRDDNDREYPFAPFLTIGFALAMLLGTPIINWYVGLFTI